MGIEVPNSKGDESVEGAHESSLDLVINQSVVQQLAEREGCKSPETIRIVYVGLDLEQFENNTDPGVYRKYLEGIWFHKDTKEALVLIDDKTPIAILGFEAEQNTWQVRQLQSFTDSKLGYNWTQLLYGTLLNTAKQHGCDKVTVVPARLNFWYLDETDETKKRDLLARFSIYYDLVPKKLGAKMASKEDVVRHVTSGFKTNDPLHEFDLASCDGEQTNS